MQSNEWGQLVGDTVSGWTTRPKPDASTLVGRYCRLERLDMDQHAKELFAADQRDRRGQSWTYMPYGPFASRVSYRRWVDNAANSADPVFYAVIDMDAAEAAIDRPSAVGVVSLLRIQPEAGSVEVGHVHYSPLLQRRRGATEAQYLLMQYAFDDLGYRRYEWKCDALNAPSRAAAQRLGFRYEGTFRQAVVVKGRNRDTAWYSIIDSEWPAVGTKLRAWLTPENFDDSGHQRVSLRTTSAYAQARITPDIRR